jgi:hypothetical protein
MTKVIKVVVDQEKRKKSISKKSSIKLFLVLVFTTILLSVNFGYSVECPEGYEFCEESGKCERIGVLSEGSPCKCYFQCKTNYCSKAGICMKALDIIFSSERDTIKVGEETKISISVDNTLDQDVKTKLTINIGTGASMSGVIAGQHCSGNQCTASLTIPARDRSDVTITVAGKSSGDVELVATITATVNYRPYQKSQNITLKVTECGDGKCEKGETKENCCTDCGCPPLPSSEICATNYCTNNRCEKRTNFLCWVFVIIITIAFICGISKEISKGR